MKSTRYFSHILNKLDFSRQIFQKYANRNFVNIRSVEVELFQAGGQTHRQA
jgi:hypothetical protein